MHKSPYRLRVGDDFDGNVDFRRHGRVASILGFDDEIKDGIFVDSFAERPTNDQISGFGADPENVAIAVDDPITKLFVLSQIEIDSVDSFYQFTCEMEYKL